jgi:hypothetical protein
VRKEVHEVSAPPDGTVLRPLPGQQEACGGHYPVADAEALEDAGYSQPRNRDITLIFGEKQTHNLAILRASYTSFLHFSFLQDFAS